MKCMTRANPNQLHPFDPEIDKTFHSLVRQSRNTSSHIGIALLAQFDQSTDTPHITGSASESPEISHFDSVDTHNMAERTLRELTTLDVNH